MIEPTSAFLFIAFYLGCVMASRVSVRPFYKRLWRVAAFVLGVCICIAAATYLAGYLAPLFAMFAVLAV